MRNFKIGTLLCIVLGVMCRVTPSLAACVSCDDVSTPDQRDECLAKLIRASENCLEYTAACSASPVVSTDPRPPKGEPFSAQCSQDGQKVILTLERSKLDSEKRITVTVGANKFVATTPKSSPAKANAAAEEAAPIDIEPMVPTEAEIEKSAALKNCNAEKTDCGGKDGVRYIYVHENLSVDRRSAQFVTETDRVIVRFIARPALLCRYYATSDEKNEYKPSVGRVGGREGLSNLLKNWSLAGAEDEKKKRVPIFTSCGKELVPADEPGHFAIKDETTDGYGYVDFTFGPFTSEQLTFHVFRHDRQFKGNDLEGEIEAANHQRYVGWVDVTLAGTYLFGTNPDIAVHRDNGTELTRIKVSEQRQQIDLLAQVKFFAVCSSGVNRWFEPQDLNVATACLGLGSGFSLLHPLDRFYPLGINLTLGRYLSLNVLSVLERSKRLASGYQSGDVFSGSASDVPTHERLVLGVGVGVGLDPTLLGELVGGIIRAGF